MMQDYPKLLDQSALVGFTQFDRGCSFSAVKNAIADGADKQRAGNAPEVAATGEQDMYAYSAAVLQAAGAKVETAAEEEFRGVRVRFPPKVIFAPSAASPRRSRSRSRTLLVLSSKF